jgi:hypothetical protein
MIDKSSEAYGEKGYKWRNHLFYTPEKSTVAEAAPTCGRHEHHLR